VRTVGVAAGLVNGRAGARSPGRPTVGCRPYSGRAVSPPPRFHLVRAPLDPPAIDDVAERTDAALAGSGVRLQAGTDVAIALGSRGIAELATVVRRVVRWVREQGAEPFVVPAMGSHGGATAAGQQAVLEAYGLGERELGCAIRSSMEVVALPADDCPVPVATDALAYRAAATILVNRVKPHTDFHGPHESGLVKMAAIGLGKRVQAEALHAYGVPGLRDLMPLVARQVLRHGNVALGVGIVENALDRPCAVGAAATGRIAALDAELLALAREQLPRLLVDELDVLLVDRMGKDISGVGMDTNVIGRLLIAGEVDPARPRIAMIGCHGLTPASHGNACGMGLADVVSRSFAAAIDHGVTRTNVVTSGFLLRGKLPVVADDDRGVWEYCLRGAAVRDPAAVRAMRIVDTLRPHEAWVSDALLPRVLADGAVLVASDLTLHHDDGSLRPFVP